MLNKSFGKPLRPRPSQRPDNKLIPAALAKQQALIDAARAEAIAEHAQAEPSPRAGRLLTTQQLALTHYTRELATDERGRNFKGYDAQWREDSAPIYAQHLRRVASGSAPDDECDGIIGWAIDAFTGDGNATVQRGTPEWRALARQLAAIQLEIEKRKDERDRGESDLRPRTRCLPKGSLSRLQTPSPPVA